MASGQSFDSLYETKCELCGKFYRSDNLCSCSSYMRLHKCDIHGWFARKYYFGSSGKLNRNFKIVHEQIKDHNYLANHQTY